MKHRITKCIALWIKLMRVSYQIVYGLWRLSKVPQPLVSIFGGARLPLEDVYAEQAHKLSNMLANADISVVTGGGSGIMEAASCGAIYEKRGKGRSVGIGVKDLGEGRNICVQEFFELDYFFARKWLLTRYSSAFIVFPGGYGTLDEMAEVLTLMQTKKIPRVPIVLIGIEFWTPFMDWLKGEALKHRLVVQENINLFMLTDDLDKAFTTVRDACEALEKKLQEKGSK